jgi:CheY-like chemotaxis protein
VPDPDLPGQLVARQIACAAINLATPSAWQAVRALRNGHGKPSTSFVAFALAAGAPTGFWFGPVDFAVLPIHDGNVYDTLARMAPRVKRVIAMSTDIDVMGEVRAQLSGKGISTAVVLDGRQALDLVPTVRPEAAVLHLSPSCVDVFRAIAGLRNTEASRNIPILFLLDATAHPQEESFLTAGVRLLSGRGNLPSGSLVNSLQTALSQSL